MSSQTRVRVLSLYKRVLRSHKILPVDLKHLGDVYVKVEFRQHKTAGAKFVEEFCTQWEAYASDLESKESSKLINLALKSLIEGPCLKRKKAKEMENKDKQVKFGKQISVDLLEKDLSADQQIQLYELMKETTKPAPQFSNIQDSEKFVNNDDKK